MPLTKGWFSLSGVNGKGDAVAGFLVAVFVYGGWDGTLYVNEEVRHRPVNPGRAAILAVALLTVIYTLSQIGFQGVLSPAKLNQADQNGTALVAVAQALGGGFWAKAMALSIALSVIATTGTGIVLGARIVYGMASYRTLPEILGTVSRRYQTPIASSLLVGLLIVILSAVYYVSTSVQNAFFDVIDVTGLLFSIFVKSLGEAPWEQRWSLIGIIIAGLILMVVARFVLRSGFFSLPRESEVRSSHRRSKRS